MEPGKPGIKRGRGSVIRRGEAGLGLFNGVGLQIESSLIILAVAQLHVYSRLPETIRVPCNHGVPGAYVSKIEPRSKFIC